MSSVPAVPAPNAPAATAPWWRDAVIYQIYVRSFADGNGDGVGDIAGIRARLPYLRDLGVDALWITPWYPSPMVDAGYDVADYCDVDPVFGTLADADALVDEARRYGIRIILDVVPNHTSHEHPWFTAAVAAGAGSYERERYIFRPGRGASGDLPPNNWRSLFGGSTWTRVTEPDGTPGEWYLHLFTPEQPDLNWADDRVREEFRKVLEFWFDRGVDGFRIDVALCLDKNPALPDMRDGDDGFMVPVESPDGSVDHPFRDRDGLHDIYREWRRIADGYPEPRVFVAEAWLPDAQRLARYLRPDELHTAFNFDFLNCPWDAGRLRAVIDATLAALAEVGAPATWVLSNHDVYRHVTRYGYATGVTNRFGRFIGQDGFDLARGVRRARAAALLMLALPGSAYLYQGEELGLPEIEDLPDGVLRDPRWARSGFTDRGRDGCRVPLPWSGDTPPFGFSPAGSTADPWLPVPGRWRGLTAQAQRGDPQSTLELYRAALRLRREEPALGDGAMRWLDAPGGVLCFAREPGVVCVVNLSSRPVALPAHREVLLRSGPYDGGQLPPDTAVWLRPALGPFHPVSELPAQRPQTWPGPSEAMG